jgi:lysophospholipase L1-like esterase
MKNVHKNSYSLNLILIIASLIVGWVMAEVGLRIIGYGGLKAIENGRGGVIRKASNPEVKYEHVPGAEVYAFDADVVINADGYRGRIGKKEKFDGFRTIVVGDSITFGNKLPVEDTYPSQMHEFLNVSNLKYEVLNFGVAGYDTLQEVALLEEKAIDYYPDLVIVGFCLNDISVVSPNLEYALSKRKSRPRWIYNFRTFELVVEVMDRMNTSEWMENMNSSEVFQAEYKDNIDTIGANEIQLRKLMASVPGDRAWYADDYRVGRLRHAFRRLSDLAADRQFSVVVVVFPGLDPKIGEAPLSVILDIVSMEAARAGFDVVELVDEYLEVGMENLTIESRDLTHPNNKGHEIAARKLVDYIHELETL